MKYAKFLNAVDVSVQVKGELLWEEGKVLDPQEISNGHWSSYVKGTKRYTTTVTIAGDTVSDYSCNCPYDWGPVCKHIVALVHAVSNITESGQTTALLTAREEIHQLAKGVKRKDLLEFLIEESNRTPMLLDNFRLRFAGKKSDSPPPDYSKMISNAVNAAEDDWGFLDEYFLEEVSDKLLKQASRHRESGNLQEAWKIWKTIISDMPGHMDRIPEDIIGVEERVSEAIGFAGELFQCEDEIDLQDEIAAFFLGSLEKHDIRLWGFDHHLWEELLEFPRLDTVSEKMLEMQNARIKGLESRPGPGSWDMTRALERKKEFLSRIGRTEDLEGFWEPYIHHPEVRRKLVKEEIAAGRYYKAKRLIREGIAIDEKKKHSIRWWQQELLAIAELEKDEAAIRLLADQLFWSGHCDFKYYETLKSTYSPEEWKDEVESMLEKIWQGKNHGGLGQANKIATILSKEKYHDRLLFLVQQNSDSYEFVSRFSSQLTKKYPAEMLEVLEKAILSFAERNTGRPAYRQLVDILKSLGRIQGGTAVKKKLVAQLRKNYSRRRAMLEIFDRSFKE